VSKKWILETNDANIADYREPNPGEYYLGLRGHGVYRAPKSPRITTACFILRPLVGDHALAASTWVYRGEYREPVKGDFAISEVDGTVFEIENDVTVKLAIVHPVAEDCVMVPRDRILILEQAVTRRSNGNLLTHIEGLTDLIDACWSIVQCAGPEVEPVEEEDAILEALKRACLVEFHGSPQHCQAILALSAREAELKERKA
jgi:hypothetical protein